MQEALSAARLNRKTRGYPSGTEEGSYWSLRAETGVLSIVSTTSALSVCLPDRIAVRSCGAALSKQKQHYFGYAMNLMIRRNLNSF